MTRRQALARAYVDAKYRDLRKQFAHNANFLAWLESNYRARITERVVDDMLVAYKKAAKAH